MFFDHIWIIGREEFSFAFKKSLVWLSSFFCKVWIKLGFDLLTVLHQSQTSIRMLNSLFLNIFFLYNFFLFSVLFHLLFQKLLSFLEFINNLLGSWYWTLHPRMSLNFGHWWSVIWLKLHHAGQKFFQFLRKILILQ